MRVSVALAAVAVCAIAIVLVESTPTSRSDIAGPVRLDPVKTLQKVKAQADERRVKAENEVNAIDERITKLDASDARRSENIKETASERRQEASTAGASSTRREGEADYCGNDLVTKNLHKASHLMAEPTPTESAIFWITVSYMILVLVMAILQKCSETSGESAFVYKFVKRTVGSELKVYDVTADLVQQAAFITIAMTISDVIEGMFHIIYLNAQEEGDADGECKDLYRFGNYACDYASDEEDLPWAVVLPSFFFAILLVPFVLWLVAKCCSKFWVELVSGFCGHIIGFRWGEGIIGKLYGRLEWLDYYQHVQDAVVGQGFVLFGGTDPTTAPELPANLQPGGFPDPSSPPGHLYESVFAAGNYEDSANGVANGYVAMLDKVFNYLQNYSDTIRSSDNSNIDTCFASTCAPRSMYQGDVGGPPADPNVLTVTATTLKDYFNTQIPSAFTDLNSTWETETLAGQSYGNYTDSDSLLCAYYNEDSYCYVPSSWQLVKPFFWYKEGAYELELWNTIWKMVVYCLLTMAFMITVRLLHNARLKSEEKLTEQQAIDQDEFDDAVTDVICDACGNAMGWTMFKVFYWMSMGVMVMVNPYQYDSQFGLNSAVLLVFLIMIVLKVVLNLVTWLKHLVMPNLKKKEKEGSRWFMCLWRNIQGITEPVVKFFIGYLIFELCRMFTFSAGADKTAKFSRMCNNGFSAFTTAWPDIDSAEGIFQTNPCAPLGQALLILSIACTLLLLDQIELKKKHKAQKLMGIVRGELKQHEKHVTSLHFEDHINHLKEVKHADKYDEALLANKTSAFSVIIALALEHTIESFSNMLANCELHYGYADKDECMEAGEVAATTRSTVIDLVTCLVIMLLFFFGNGLLLKCGVTKIEEEEEGSDSEGEETEFDSSENPDSPAEDTRKNRVPSMGGLEAVELDELSHASNLTPRHESDQASRLADLDDDLNSPTSGAAAEVYVDPI